MISLGTVTDLWRYPVKSMQGESLTSAEVSARGLLGDRAYAFIDSVTGKIVSAKNPRKWPSMLACTAVFDGTPVDAPVRVTFADGTTLSSSDAGFDDRASGILGRQVTLRSAPVDAPVLEEYWPDIEGLEYRETVTDESMSNGTASPSFFDYSAIHLLTSSTLAALQAAYPDGRFDPCRFRPNLLIGDAADGFPENEWVGRKVQVGDEVVFEILSPCARCVMTILPQRGLPLDSRILATVANRNTVMIARAGQAMPSVGVYAKVVRGGNVRAGDPVAFVS